MQGSDSLKRGSIEFDGVTDIQRVQVVIVDPRCEFLASRVDNERLTALGLRQPGATHDGRAGCLGNAI
jgi:hypothetical protein